MDASLALISVPIYDLRFMVSKLDPKRSGRN